MINLAEAIEQTLIDLKKEKKKVKSGKTFLKWLRK